MKISKKPNPDPRRGLPEGAWFYEPLPGFPSDPGSQYRFFKESKNEAEAVREAKGMIRALGPEVVVERPTTPGGPFRLHHGEDAGARGLFDMERSWFPQVSNLNPSSNPHTDSHQGLASRVFVRRNRSYVLVQRGFNHPSDDFGLEFWLVGQRSDQRRPVKKLHGSRQEILDTLYKEGYREQGRVSGRILEEPSRYVMDNPSRSADSRWVKPKRGGRLWENTGRTNGGWTVILWQDTGRGAARKTLLVSLENFRKNWVATDKDGNFTKAVHAPDPSPRDNPGYHRRRNPDDLKPLSGSSAKQVKYGEDMRRQLLPRIDAAVEQTPELSEPAKLMRAMPTARFWIDLSQRGADVLHSLLNTDLGEQSVIMRYYAKPAEISTRRGMTKVGGTRPYLRKYYFTGRAESLGVDKGEVATKKRKQEEWAEESARSSPVAKRARKRQEEKEEQGAEDEYERRYRESGQLDRDIDEWKIGRYDPGSQHYEEERAAGAGYPMGKP